ncbi:MAG: carbohydrate ABC transporter permease [Lentisphaeria bacterium]|nr:carbohydrate ABC transporter permease [Lentisphaeria bacterium]NQZ67764.1 carbohydrate ABC transporter permease [Lentisphaeria bacterium]
MFGKIIRSVVIGLFLLCAVLPMFWVFMTSIRTKDAAIGTQLRIIPGKEDKENSMEFKATTEESFQRISKPVIKGDTNERTFLGYLFNSIIIAGISTLCAVLLGTSTAYGFSRFKIPGSKDWLFFILSTRFLPPLAVVVPILFMYRTMNLNDSHLGMIILYTAFNLSLAVWLMKGFIDEIPKAYEEAALVDGYTQLQAFIKIIIPEAMTGMAVTGVFCLIAAWNEYGFALILNNDKGVWTAPVFFGGQKGLIEGTPWPLIAAGIIIFVFPVLVFVSLVRNHLLRGMTFGTVKG